MPVTTGPRATFAFVSLGCAKNLVDSERMLGLLGSDGYAIQCEPAGADFVLINTCGFIEAARRESLAVIREMAALKRQGRLKRIVVCGCLAERDRRALIEQVPEIDAVVGVFGREQIAAVLRQLAGGGCGQPAVFQPPPAAALDDRARLRITPPHFAYLKIAEGCDRPCTFCTIPAIRGPYVSKPLEQVVEEAQELAADGAVELNLIAQDTTYYGCDLYGEPSLARLLAALEQVEGIRWIRLLYCYPWGFTDQLLDVLAGSNKVVRYLDLPLQHISSRMLRLMGRQVSRPQTERLIARLRGRLPGLVLRTTFMVGAPGETRRDFDQLASFVAATRFERMGVFEYSLEADTPAARLPGRVRASVKARRRARLMELQQQIAFDWSRRQVGRTLEVLIERPARRPAGQPDWWIGRSYADAPDIDGCVRVRGAGLRPGQFVPARITAADGYDLVGEVSEQAGAERAGHSRAVSQ